MTNLGEVLSDISTNTGQKRLSVSGFTALVRLPYSAYLKRSYQKRPCLEYSYLTPLSLNTFCQKFSILKGYLVKGAMFLFSDFQLKIPILMRPGHWSRRGNTD